MNYLIYCSVVDEAITKGLLDVIKGISEKLYNWNCIIKFENRRVIQHTSSDMCECVRDFLSNKILGTEDEVYIYYWSTDLMSGVWRLKKKGCLNIKPEHDYLHCLESSLGAKLGILD